jgi:trehalose 6-phosphate synthase/phosphatase
MNKHDRMLIVSNRLPVVLEEEDGEWKMRPGSGGLVTAMAPVLRNRGGVWIGWSGLESESNEQIEALLNEAPSSTGYRLCSVPLSAPEVDLYYQGFSNEVLWPLFHDLQSLCRFRPEYWDSYLAVNCKFASVIAEEYRVGDYVWVHDYHLIHVGEELRRRGIETSVGFFLHIPFPAPDIFIKLPWRFQLLHALLQYDLIGFQTVRDHRNFVQCVRMLMKDVAIRHERGMHICTTERADVRLGVFPISIDFRDFEQQARSQEISESAWYIHEAVQDRQIVLGVDRLDYTKGIPNRLEAFHHLLRTHPEIHERVTFIQVVVPSRSDIAGYEALKTEIEQLVSRINGEFTIAGWIPVHYIYRHLTRQELLGYYRTAEVAFVTPIRDGMNLVAKEYCACNIDGNGVLILSEFAGAVQQLHRYALVVNPYDVSAVGQALFEALEMPVDERQRRMHRLRAIVRRHDIFRWVETFLHAAIEKDLRNFPLLEEYIPSQ